MLESALLVISLCIDACIASFAYGTDRIKIPLKSTFVLTGISTLFLIISMLLGSGIRLLLPDGITVFICFGVLFVLGVIRLFEGLLKNFLSRKAVSPEHIELHLFDFKLILNIYANATLADTDHSKILSAKEAIYLGIAISLDSLVVGFGAALVTINFGEVILFSLLFNSLAIVLGSFLGHKFAEKLHIDLSWLSGAVLIILAILKLF